MGSCTLTMTVAMTGAEVQAYTSCSCGAMKRSHESPEDALAEWRAHAVRRSFARKFTS